MQLNTFSPDDERRDVSQPEILAYTVHECRSIEAAQAADPDRRVDWEHVEERNQVRQTPVVARVPSPSNLLQVPGEDSLRQDRRKSGGPHQSGNEQEISLCVASKYQNGMLSRKCQRLENTDLLSCTRVRNGHRKYPHRLAGD
jgi:hypothetical protein